jgi:hypothetical protein
MYAQFSELERENIRDRTVTARQRRARQGVLPGGAYPYWLMRGDDDKPLLDPERTPAILWAIEQYMRDGTRTRDILRYLRENFPPYRRALGIPHTWSTAALMRSLRHPALWGEFYYSRLGEQSDDRPLRRLRMHQKAERPERSILVNVPPVLHRNDDDLATCQCTGGCEMDSRPTGTALAQRVEQRRWDSPRNTKHEYPLRRKVVCAVCDTVLVARAPQSYWKVLKDGRKVKYAWKTPPIRLRCSGHQRREKGQRCRIKDDVNGRHVWTSVKATLRNHMLQSELAERSWSAFDQPEGDGSTSPHAAEYLVGELERIKERIAALLADTDESLEDVRRATEHLKTRRLAVEHELSLLTIQKREALTHDQAAEQRRLVIDKVRELNLDDIEEQEWSHLANLLIDRIAIDRDNALTMRLNFELGEIPVPWVVGLYAAGS